MGSLFLIIFLIPCLPDYAYTFNTVLQLLQVFPHYHSVHTDLIKDPKLVISLEAWKDLAHILHFTIYRCFSVWLNMGNSSLHNEGSKCGSLDLQFCVHNSEYELQRSYLLGIKKCLRDANQLIRIF